MKTAKAKRKATRSRKAGTKKSAKAKTSVRRKEQKLSGFESLINQQAADNSIESEDVFVPPENPLDPIPEEVLAKFRKIRFLPPVGKPDRVAKSLIRAMHEYFDEQEALAHAHELKTSGETKKASVISKNRSLPIARKASSPKKPRTRENVSG
jgi:hypothetical protein